MQTTLLDLNNSATVQLDAADVTLSFNSFIDFLQKRIADEKTNKKAFLEYAFTKLMAKKDLLNSFSLQDAHLIEDELCLIYNLLVPVIEDEKEQLWGLSVPLKPQFFYGTDSFYKLLLNEDTGNVKCEIINKDAHEESKKMKMKLLCSLILEKMYHFPPMNKNELSYSFLNEATGLNNYFKINIDTRFVEVKAKQQLPELNLPYMVGEMEGNDFDWQIIFNMLHPSLFSFSGFSIITATDITAAQAVENIKTAIINRHPADDSNYYKIVVDALKTIIENNDIDFGLQPVFKVNNKLVFTNENRPYNVMVQAFTSSGHLDAFYTLTEKYLENPKALLYQDITEVQKDNMYIRRLAETGIVSYGLMPVYSGNNIAGVLEVYSKKKNMLISGTLSKLDAAIPLLSQLFQHDIDEFENKIESIIKDKFTSLQPAVEWKFRDIAWQYYNQHKMQDKNNREEKIIFKEVYPLYGAIDIRNSTIERNNAQSADLTVQFKLLVATLTAIKEQVNITIADELIFKCNTWLKAIETKNINEDNLKVTEFLEEEINPFLDYFEDNNEALKPVVKKYRDDINEATGIVYYNRRILETSMQNINAAIAQYLDLFAVEVQSSYPCYFEKFRTDGIEYDIYIGQSITPGKAFNNLYLKNIRLWQLNSMVAIAKLTHALQPQLEKKMETTQLIFIRSAALDISFRNDERRFDVEGSYNIRYQVIKKRIDKVHVKTTGERLTQPGKIALVYFNKKEADEYQEYIKYLQSQQMLKKEIEYLELEELQGVTGLKAIRVSVVIEEEVESK